MTFWVLAVLGVILFAGVLFSLPETLPAEKAAPQEKQSVVAGFGKLFKQRQFVLFALTQAFMTAALFAYISGSSFVLQKIFGLSVTTFGIVYAINGAGIAFMSSMSGRWAAKFGEYTALKWFIRVAFIGGLWLLATAFMPKSIWMILPPLFIVVSTVGGIISLTTALGDARTARKCWFSISVVGFGSLRSWWFDVTNRRVVWSNDVLANGSVDCCRASDWSLNFQSH